jgi:peroxiredoxin
VFPKPAGLANAPRICLLIRGTRLNHNGWSEETTGGDYCRVSSHEPILVAPLWWLKMMIPIWWPYPPEERGLDHMIAAHVNAVADRPPARPLYNTLVHFTGPRIERPLERLAAIVEHVQSSGPRQDSPLVTIVVLPRGTLSLRRRDVEERLGSAGERYRADLIITEDYAGGWTQAFSPGEVTSTHLLDAFGRFVWNQDGALQTNDTIAAFQRFAVPGPQPQRVAMSLSLSPGDRAPDAPFADDQGNVFAFRRLSGRTIALVFWQSWSAPCIEQLRYLERESAHEGGPYVIAVNGGESAETIAEARARYGLSLPLTPDPEQRIAAAYGVKCWPTTISINSEGIIERIQFGLAPAARATHGERAS